MHKNITIGFVIISLFLFVEGISFLTAKASENMIFPGSDWVIASPESQGVDPAKLNEAVSYLEANSGSYGVSELVIIKNGRMIYEGRNIDNRHAVWSMTKSFTSAVLGLLIDDGDATLGTLAKNYAPDLSNLYNSVTLRHFTTMTSGYRALGDVCRSGGYCHGTSLTWYDPDTPLFAPPGSKFAYWDSAMNELAYVLTQMANEPIKTYFKDRIADPIGMNRNKWDWRDFGQIGGIVVNGGSGNNSAQIVISAREMARFGHLFLNRGNWDGQQLISSSWVDEATSVQVPSTMPWGYDYREGLDGRGVYGYNWWVNGVKPNGERKWPSVPASTYAASGAKNNDMFVIPDWGMVIVRLAKEKDFTITDDIYDTFLGKIGQASHMATATPTAAATATATATPTAKATATSTQTASATPSATATPSLPLKLYMIRLPIVVRGR